jgi:hypothetical protein
MTTTTAQASTVQTQPGVAPPEPRASAPTPRRRRAVSRVLRWRNTPERIRGLTALAAVIAIALGVVTAAIFASVNSGVRQIGGQADPEVNHTTDLYLHLNDMDAQLANVLLVAGAPNLGMSRSQALVLYQQDRAAVDSDLQQGAAVAGSSRQAQLALVRVLDGLGKYEELAGQITYLEQATPSQPGRPPARALALYRQATDLLKSQILPPAQLLTAANAAALNSTYQAKRSQAQLGIVWVLLIGLALLAVLVALQLLIAARHRRLLNPALAGASLVTLVLAIWASVLLGAQANHLFVAKKDAFDSIIALTQARAVSYDANADESRFLVDPGRAARYQDAFEAKSQRLAGLSGVGSVFQYDAALAKAIDAYRANHADVTFQGYFGAEFRNITFTGERAAAQRTLYAYQAYERDDRRIRALNASGDLRGAIAFDTSLAPGNSNWAFYRYDTDLQALTKINQNAFGQAIGAAESGGTGWNGPFPIIGAVAVIILALAGVRSRLAEYR